MYGMIICKFRFNVMLEIIIDGNIITALCSMRDAQICHKDFFRDADRYVHPL